MEELSCLETEVINVDIDEDEALPEDEVIEVGPPCLPMQRANDQNVLVPMQSENDENVVVIDKEKEERKKRRRMIRRMLKPGATPSFVALVTPLLPEEEEKTPKRTRIDVDEYLGLKKKKVPSQPAVETASNAAALPSEEGWYEGVVPLALPDDARYLPELQVLIRSNLELFSATDAEINIPQPGRRTPTVRGKVGVRCIHCTKAVRSNPSLSWPAGSISYPHNTIGIYPLCSQKPAIHFQNCPYMPPEMKDHFRRLTFDEDGKPRRQKVSAAADGDSSKPMTAVFYYTVAAKRIGLVDVPGSGLRFGRDLALEPLPIETVRAELEETKAPYKRGTPAAPTPSFVPSSEPRITADEESERVLAQAVAEKDNDKLLARSDDKKLLTDFIFLCCKQMAICHAMPSDMASRGKKTRMMRIGFCGFCCRHCAGFNADDKFVKNVDYSCRSFSSAADNLSSAISNSFYLHIQKCPSVPAKIRHALSAYKRIHTRQMSRLPYGSQRRLFQILWSRMRDKDLTAEEMEEQIKLLPPQPQPMLSSSTASLSDSGAVASESNNGAIPDTVMSNTSDGTGRGAIPICSDEETAAILKKAENQDTSINDHLIRPSDRHLVSDYVFLMMHQLKAAHPSLIDFTRGKRTTVINTSQPGLQCIHCVANQSDGFYNSTVGRSFPSAPDNMASSLNSSLYQHLQRCRFVPADVKRALMNLKKLHSLQCASLRFGSQRRFFNLVFERLYALKIEKPVLQESQLHDEEMDSAAAPPEQEPTGVTTGPADEELLMEGGFIESSVGGCYECQFCRMVPFALRAPGSMFMEHPSCELIRRHKEMCMGSSFDLSNAAEALMAVIDKYPSLQRETIVQCPAFRNVVKAVVAGNEGLIKIFTEGLAQAMQGNAKSIESDGELWNKFPASIDLESVRSAFTDFAEIVPGMDQELTKERCFVRFLHMISPGLVLTSTTSL